MDCVKFILIAISIFFFALSIKAQEYPPKILKHIPNKREERIEDFDWSKLEIKVSKKEK